MNRIAQIVARVCTRTASYQKALAHVTCDTFTCNAIRAAYPARVALEMPVRRQHTQCASRADIERYAEKALGHLHLEKHADLQRTVTINLRELLGLRANDATVDQLVKQLNRGYYVYYHTRMRIDGTAETLRSILRSPRYDAQGVRVSNQWHIKQARLNSYGQLSLQCQKLGERPQDAQ